MTNSHSVLIQVADGPKGDPAIAEFLGFGQPFSAGQFVSIVDAGAGKRYLGHIETAALNLNRNALDTYSNATINQFEGLLQDRISREAIINECRLYRVKYLKDLSNGAAGSVRVRSGISSEGHVADEAEVISALNLPRITDLNWFGHIRDTDIRLALNQRLLVNHVLVSGTTGSGKSNLIGNVIAIGQEIGAFVVVYDHKPDYARMDEPNDEGDERHYRALKNTTFWTLGSGRGNKIMLPANVLDHDVLAHTLFHRPNESNQAEETERLLENFVDAWGESEPFGIVDFENWLHEDQQSKALAQALRISKATYEAIVRKIGRPARRPSWLLKRVPREMFSDDMFDIQGLAGPGKVVVIDVGSGQGGLAGRSYALFLSYALRELSELRGRGFPVLHVIDEAQDIFNAPRDFKDLAGLMMNNFIRKGRSQKIGFVIGVQSAELVPEDIRNNMNTEIVFRHKRPEQVSKATASLSWDQAVQTSFFGPGECFVSMLGAGAVVHCQARRSPFRLPREDD